MKVSARAALAGNPSDLYGGAVLAIPVPQLAATVTLAEQPGVVPPNDLVEAALARVAARVGVRWSTTIPRSVGLAGSSALVIATLRAAGVDAGPLELAQLALSIERDDLGIVAGLQDRATQAFVAPVLVDGDAVRALRPTRPLSFVVAWSPSADGDSGEYHRNIDVDHGAMHELAGIAREAAEAFERGDAGQLAVLMDASARTRQRAAPLPPAHEELADAARRAGFRPNSTGSGGAIVAVVEGEPAQIGADYVIEMFG
ncbi:MAG: hypothetical protein H0U92_01675 [Actinobacteria bacterium]|nr:hypothetical protein [Actinomycetota bacterium]